MVAIKRVKRLPGTAKYLHQMIIRWDSESIEPLMREIEEWEMDRGNSQNPQKGCW